MSNKEIKKYDDKGNLIYCKYPTSGCESIYKYDENNNLIYWKHANEDEFWREYDENSNEIEITEQEYKEIEFRKKEKEYLSRTKCSRFELMDI